MEILQQADPDGVKARKGRRLKRRVYRNKVNNLQRNSIMTVIV